MRPSMLVKIVITGGALALIGSAASALQPAPSSAKWVSAWGTSQQSVGMTAISNATVRMIARVTASGQAVRIRLDNTFGAMPLSVGKIYIGPRIQAAVVAAGGNRQAFFGKSASVTIPAGSTSAAMTCGVMPPVWCSKRP